MTSLFSAMENIRSSTLGLLLPQPTPQMSAGEPELRILNIYSIETLPQDARDLLVTFLQERPQDVADALRHLHKNRTPLHSGDFVDAFSTLR